METICLFGSDYASREAVHQALKDLLSLPDYYGMNADALADCLSEYAVCPALWFRADGPQEVQDTLRLAARVFQDQDGMVKEL